VNVQELALLNLKGEATPLTLSGGQLGYLKESYCGNTSLYCGREGSLLIALLKGKSTYCRF
jgi:hypothetical protein